MKKVALLVSDSGLWGIWCYRALKKANLDFQPILSNDLTEDFSKRFTTILVPGGWSANKLSSLGRRGCKIVQDFVEEGGLYVGICGGAGLATSDGLGLLKVRRTKERVPSYSGPFYAKVKTEHSLFKNLGQPIFYLWFPPSFVVEDEKIEVLATFHKPHPSAYTSDLPLGDIAQTVEKWETLYGLNLNPEKMKGKPLLVLGQRGKGKVLLSLIHFDTPYHKKGEKILQNLIDYFGLARKVSTSSVPNLENKAGKSLKFYWRFYAEARALLKLGLRNFLLFPRESYFFQWRRGIRGLEAQNLYFMLKEIVEHLPKVPQERLDELSSLHPTEEDVAKVFRFLKGEYLQARYKLQNLPHLTTLKGRESLDEESIEVFGENTKSYGGLYRKVLNQLEAILVALWREP